MIIQPYLPGNQNRHRIGSKDHGSPAVPKNPEKMTILYRI
jgi:hypothetical protein